jgi:glycine/D-amino acid oxidase-like deaminating enzyme
MLEARQACSGATGRNGGHCRVGNYIRFEEDVENFGVADAAMVQKLEEANVKNVKELIADLKIECDWRLRVGTEIYTCPVFWNKVLSALRYRNEYATKVGMEFSTKFEIWSAEETRERLLVPDSVGSIHFPSYTLHPYLYVCALIELCLEKGLNLQTNTPVTRVFPKPEGGTTNSWVVQTERGNIVAEKVILATNAYTGMLYPPLAKFVIPTRGQLAAVRPGSKIDGNPILDRTTVLVDATTFQYWQRRPDGTLGEGDMLFGS